MSASQESINKQLTTAWQRDKWSEFERLIMAYSQGPSMERVDHFYTQEWIKNRWGNMERLKGILMVNPSMERITHFYSEEWERNSYGNMERLKGILRANPDQSTIDHQLEYESRKGGSRFDQIKRIYDLPCPDQYLSPGSSTSITPLGLFSAPTQSRGMNSTNYGNDSVNIGQNFGTINIQINKKN